ncbi:MAG: hypothetical protein ACO3UU_07450, partial [Minisyncoccia bacterium]
MSNWLDLSHSSNLLKQAYIKGFVDISGGDLINRNGKLLIQSDASLNSNVYVGDKLHVGVQESSYHLDISGNSRFLNDIGIKGKSQLDGDVSMNANVDISGNLIIKGNLSVFQTKETETINTTVNNYTLIVTEDISLNGNLFISGDISSNNKLDLLKSATLRSTLNVSKAATMSSTLDVTGAST